MMTPAEIDQLIGEKIAVAITAYAAIQNNGESSQGIMARNAEGRIEGKRKCNEDQERSFTQHPNKRQEVVKADDAGKRYKGKHPYCGRWDRHHPGPCNMVCNKCQKIGHETRNWRNTISKAVAPRGCYECGVVGHIKRSCPKLKKQTLRAYEIIIEERHGDPN